MDHFNSTVHNGTLVSTRRGLHVSKTKHHGTRFVNTFASPTGSDRPSQGSFKVATRPAVQSKLGQFNASPYAADSTLLKEQKFKFVAKPRKATLIVSREKRRSKNISVNLPTPSNSGSDSGDDAVSTFQPDLSFIGSQNGRGLELDFSNIDSDELLSVLPSVEVPKPWKSHFLIQGCLGESDQYVPHQYLFNTPRQLYPSEELLTYNPVRDANFFDCIQSSPVTSSSCAMTVALSKAILLGDEAFAGLEAKVGTVCALVNQWLSDKNPKTKFAVMEAIAAMALVGVFTRRFDHWHVHMKGLRYVVECSGGLRPELGHVLNKVRKADIKGAAYVGGSTHLDFQRFFPPISDVLNSKARADYALSIQHVLQLSAIQQVNIESMRNLVFFAQTIKLARESSGTLRFDPHSCVEECMWVEYQLVQFPCALGQDEFLEDILSSQRDITSNHVLGMEVATMIWAMPATGTILAPAANLLDPLIRIVGILFIEEILGEPRTLDTYRVLLRMLDHQVRTIVLRLHHRVVSLDGIGYIMDGLPPTDAMRPILIWVSLVAYALGSMPETEVCFSQKPLDRTPYQDCMAIIIGSSPSDVDALPDSDFELCRLLPPQQIRLSSADNRTLLKDIITDYESNKLMSMTSMGSTSSFW